MCPKHLQYYNMGIPVGFPLVKITIVTAGLVVKICEN